MIRSDHISKIVGVCFIVVLSIFRTGSLYAQSVTPATGGAGISADNFATGTWTTLTGPVITETAPGQIQAGEIRLEAPTGFEWDTGGTAPAVTVTAARALRITANYVSSTGSEVVFSVSGGSAGSPPNNIHTLSFSNLRIRPVQGAPLVSGIIRNTGAAVPGGNINYGSLSIVAGADALIRVETQPDASGDLLIAQDLEAGSSITVYSNVRDQFGNFKRNQSSSWSLTNLTGGVVPGDLSASGGNALLTGNLTGSASIQADFGALTAVPTPVITILPSDPFALFIGTQPAGTATAGIAFSTQPVIEVQDQYTNIVTTDDFTTVTASVETGSGNLLGTTNITANNGLVSYSDLFATVAENITIRFNAAGLTPVVSNTVTVNPGAADDLQFAVQPSNASLNTPLTPAVEVQLLDAFSNPVSQSGVNISLSIDSGTGNISGNTSATGTGGIAIFNSLSFDLTGLKTIIASSTGLNDSAPSDGFTIANVGELAGFQVLSSGGGNIGEQTAGLPFDLRIVAVDGLGNILDGSPGQDNFTGNIDLSTSSEFTGTTTISNIGPFVNGVFDPAEVTLTQSDSTVTITATNSAGTESGSSDPFNLNAAAASADSSFFTVSKDTLIAGGDTAEILVTLRDEYGNLLRSGGDNVGISLTGTGSLSTLIDNNNGTYSATLTSPSGTGSATVNVLLDGAPVASDDPDVVYIFGELDSFLIEAAGGGPVTDQVAGVPFDIQVTAQDVFGNIVASFDSVNATVIISSSADLQTGEGTTPEFEDGFLSNWTVSITSSGITKLEARRTANTETGLSNDFDVLPAAADPVLSQITAASNFLESNGTDATIITVQLVDQFNNPLRSGGDNVQLNATAGASLSPVSDNGNGTYTSTLTAGGGAATVTITGTLNGTPITDNEVVTVSQFNIWDGGGGGSPTGRTDWGNVSRWTLGLPTTGQVVLIPSGQTYYPIIDGEDPVLDFLEIQAGASVIINGRNLTINNGLSGTGSLLANNGNVTFLGDIEINNFIGGTTNVVISGSQPAIHSGDFTALSLILDKNLSSGGFIETLSDFNISAGNTLELEEGATLRVGGDLNLNGNLIGTGTTVELSGDLNGENINLTDSDLILNGSTEQVIRNFDQLSNLTIDNPAGVVVDNDLVVEDTLFISDGILTINSGNSLVSNTKTGLTSNIRILREITGNQGWRLLSSPMNTDYDNFLDGTITQGYSGAFYSTGGLPGDTLQPNVFYYDETFEGTDNQRFRAPTAASDAVTAGRGHFVYFFDDIAVDPLYNDELPDTLDVLGSENDGNGFSFTFPVTYTPEADTGWNLVGNPFAATIDWDDGNWTKQNLDNVIYVWDESANDYLTWNGTAGSLGEGRVKPFQAFWVKANGGGSPRLQVDKQTKTTGGTFYKQVRDDKPVIELLLESGNLSKTTHMSFQSEGSYAKDSLDAYRLLPFDTDTFLELYTLFNDGTQISINNLPRDFGIPIDIPLYVGGFENGIPVNGPFTLSWPVFKDVPDGWTIELEDRDNGETINMKEQNSYAFNLNGSRAKTSFIRNGPDNFRLTEKNRSKINSSRFMLNIQPGEDADGLPSTFELFNNYPNPFNASTTIRFATPLEGPVSLEVYDVLGRKVATLTDRNFPAGFHDIRWNSSGLASGIYIYRLVTGGGTFVKKMSLIK